MSLPDEDADDEGTEHEFRVEADDGGSRVDVFLVRHVPHMSRAKAKALAAKGKVRVDGHRVPKGHRVSAGEVVSLAELPPPTDFEPAPNADLPLTIVHEDAHLVVVDKAPDLPCHPLRPEERETVVNALITRSDRRSGRRS